MTLIGMRLEEKGTDVFITASCAGRPYFRDRSTLIMDASRPFKAEMLSAKRQFIGMLGLEVPSKRTFDAASAMPWGSVGAMGELFRMPLMKTF